MRVILAGVGRLKAGPERDLVDRYAGRARALGRNLGFAGLDLFEIGEGRQATASERMRDEAARLRDKLPADAQVVAFDERGRTMSSREFAGHLASERDRGASAVAMVIGGPDGLEPDFRESAHRLFAFGAATLPHQLVRILAAEQIYRALTIIAGHPYHRD